MVNHYSRPLTSKEIEAIHRVELSGKQVDYAAIKKALCENTRKGVGDKEVFSAIYSSQK